MHSPIEETRQRINDEADLYAGLCLDEERYEMGKRDASRATAETLVSPKMMSNPSYQSGYREVLGWVLQPAFVTGHKIDASLDERDLDEF